VARYVVDPQTLLRVVADDRRVAPGHQLVAPNSVRSDALGLLLTAVREGDLSEKEALATHTHLTELKMRLLGDRVSRGTAWQLARDHDWDSLHWAEYLAVARLQADALVTVNAELAALARGIVTVEPYEALFRT
jgi:predicted nucleic acid-binding protein